MSHFCITFPLKTEKYQEDILHKRFEIARKMYNALITLTLKRYRELIKTQKYREIQSELKALYGTEDPVKHIRQTELYKQLNSLYKSYRLNEYAFHTDIKPMQKHFKTNIDSFTAQKLATHLWRAYEKLLFGDGEEIHYKKYDTLYSLEGKSNRTGIRYKEGNLRWNGLKIPVVIDKQNPYEAEAMEHEIAYCRIIRKFIRGKDKFYLQIVCKGKAPVKIHKETGEIKHALGSGKVGIDIGTQTAAIVGEKEVKLLELADRVQNIEDQRRRLLRYMDRSKRSTTPDNFQGNGAIRAGKKLLWVFSQRYQQARKELKEIYRKQADIRKQQHEILANQIISLGEEFYVETMNFKGLQARSKKTEKNEEGKYKKKKRFGKSLANKAPAMFLSILERKLHGHGKTLHKIHTAKVKASQYQHIEDRYQKKSLSERWNTIGEEKVQRDLYAAFLIRNVKKDLETIDKEICDQTFENFIKLHNEEIKRLNNTRLAPALKNVL